MNLPERKSGKVYFRLREDRKSYFINKHAVKSKMCENFHGKDCWTTYWKSFAEL